MVSDWFICFFVYDIHVCRRCGVCNECVCACVCCVFDICVVVCLMCVCVCMIWVVARMSLSLCS